MKMKGEMQMCLSYTTEAGGNSPLVLLVEDDASLANLLTEVLSVEIFNGKLPFYHVEQVRSERAAKSLLRNTPPALCIVEHHPPMIDGLRLYDQMCAIYGTEQIPALLISNDLPQMELIRRQFSGLQKPFDLEQFIRLVREILAVSQERGDPQRGKEGEAHALEPHPCASSLREPAVYLSWTAIRAWPFLPVSEQRGFIYQ